jgi:hypothetical protein
MMQIDFSDEFVISKYNDQCKHQLKKNHTHKNGSKPVSIRRHRGCPAEMKNNNTKYQKKQQPE